MEQFVQPLEDLPERVEFIGNPTVMRDGAKCAPAVPEGVRVYAVGDIHGRLDLLERLDALIEADMSEGRPDQVVEVYLGDYVDRGDNTRGVIDWLLREPVGRTRHCLKGNHEEMLMKFLDDPHEYFFWSDNGGRQTLSSYGIDDSPYFGGTSVEKIRDVFVDALGGAQKNFLDSLEVNAVFGDYFFVHAGVRPELPLDEQSVEDCLWIRSDFLRSNFDWGKIIVHGHTPREKVQVASNRIGLDTGAVFGGALSCLVLEGERQRLLQVKA